MEILNSVFVSQFEHRGLPCSVLKVMFLPGFYSLCGYVGLTKRHPHYKKRANDIRDVNVTGGVVFADNKQPVFGSTPDIWWVGFKHTTEETLVTESEEALVEKECRKLAEQLVDLSPSKNVAPIPLI